MSIVLIQENISEHFRNLENYFQTTFSSFGRFYLNSDEIPLNDIFYLDIFFNENGEESIYYSKTSFSNKGLYYFGLDSNPLIKNNKLINLEDFISPQLILSFNLDCSKGEGIVFGSENNNIFLLSPIDFSSLSDEDISILQERNNIEFIEEKYYINFGKFDEGVSLLKKIRNFLSHFHIDNNIFDYIKLLPKTDSNSERINFINKDTKKENNFCMCCGENINESYFLHQDIKKIAGGNPNKCASCFSKILMSYFISEIENKTNNKSYLIFSAKKPELVKFYLKLLETNGIIKRTSNIEFKEELNICEKYFNEIPEEYLIEFKENLNNAHEEIIKNIDNLTLFGDGVLNIDFEKLLIDKGLTLEKGWVIREELIKHVISGEFKKKSKKHIIKHIKKRIKELSKSPTPKKIFKHSQDLIKLTVDPNGNFNNAFIEKLNNNNLSIEDGEEIIREIKREIDDGKLISISVETRLNQLFKDKRCSSVKKFENN